MTINVSVNWEKEQLQFLLPTGSEVRRLEPTYPPPLKAEELIDSIQDELFGLKDIILKASGIVLVVEDSTRVTKTGQLVSALLNHLNRLRDGKGLEVIIAAGAHAHLPDQLHKLGVPCLSYRVHHVMDETAMALVGFSRTGIPLLFNRRVVEADLRLTVSTLNIHPMAGFSGGGKIFLPGVAGLETIQAFHDLPDGTSGFYDNPKWQLINEALSYLPVAYSWQCISRPDGEVVGILRGQLPEVHIRGIETLRKMVSISPPEPPADLLLAGCAPFNQNLLGTFKALSQLPKLLTPGGRVIMFNEAYLGAGEHYWRNQPEVVEKQKNHFENLFAPYQVGVFSPRTDVDDFTRLFPASFRLLKTRADLDEMVHRGENRMVTVLPHAPVTLISEGER